MKSKILIVSLVILAGGAGANLLRYSRSEPQQWAKFEVIPYEYDGYQGEERRFSEQAYQILQADTTTLRLYQSPEGQPIWLFIGYFESQKYGSQIHSPRNCLPGSGWKIANHVPYTLDLGNGRVKVVNRLIITRNQQRSLMLYWFETRGGSIRNEYALKLDLVKNSLLFRPTDAAFIRVNLPLSDGDDIDSVADCALAFLGRFYPAIEQALPFAN